MSEAKWECEEMEGMRMRGNGRRDIDGAVLGARERKWRGRCKERGRWRNEWEVVSNTA